MADFDPRLPTDTERLERTPTRFVDLDTLMLASSSCSSSFSTFSVAFGIDWYVLNFFSNSLIFD